MNDIILSDVKNCGRLLEHLDSITVIITSHFDLLWKQGETVSKPAATCHAKLFGKDEPCDGCPLLKSPDNPSSPSVVHAANGAYLVEIHALANASGYLALHHDIGTIVRTTRRLQDILKHIPLGIVLTNKELQVEYISPAFFEIFPFVKSPFEGKDFHLTISRHSPPFPKELLDFIFHHSKTGIRTSKRMRFDLPAPDSRSIEVMHDIFLDETGDSSEKRIFFFADRTHEAMEQKIQRQIALQSELDALFREIYTTLSPGLKSLKTLTVKAEESEDTARIVQIVQTEADRLLKTLKKMGKLGKRRKGDLEALNLNRLISEILKNLRPKYDRNNIKIKTKLTRHIRLVYGDREKLERSLTILLERAIEDVTFKSENSPGRFSSLIEIQTRMHDEILEIQIRDNGPGMEKKEDPDNDLFLCRLTIQSMGGEMEIQSVKNVGTKTVIRIPTLFDAPSQKRKAITKTPSSDPEQPGDSGKAKRKRIQSIFSDMEIWILGEKDFAGETIQGFTAKNGARIKIIERPDAFSHVLRESHSPDCLVLNWTDERSALAFISILRENRLFSKTIFAVPQEFLPTLKKKIREHKELKIIGKPFSLDALMETLTACLIERA